MLPPLPDPLREAWSATRYMFAARGALYEARVGQISPAISRFLTEQAVESGVFLSAFNPGLPAPGEAMTEMYPQLTPTENAARLEMLWGELGSGAAVGSPMSACPTIPRGRRKKALSFWKTPVSISSASPAICGNGPLRALSVTSRRS